MSDIKKGGDSSYSRYEKLILERDALKREAGAYLTSYIKNFGELINKVFEKKIDCISKKKSIAFCQASVNRGERIDADELQKYLDSAMALYEKQLSQMLKDYKEARSSKPSSEYDIIRCKSLYRKIAKLIHPDINPAVWEFEEIEELWNRTLSAYKLNSVGELQDLEVLIHKLLDEKGFEPEDIVIENAEERIRELEEEIRLIISTDPYLYKELLEDEAASEQKKKELEEELESYIKYSEELSVTLRKYLGNGVITKWEEA